MKLPAALVPASARPKASLAIDEAVARMPFMTTWGLTPNQERIGNDFEGYVQGAYKAAGVVFACIAARQLVFSEARFQWREFKDGRPGPLFDSSELKILARPWANGTTGELLSRMEADASLAGNSYETTADDLGRFGNASRGGPGRRIVRMRPDWVTLIIGSHSGDPYALDAKVVAFQYWPFGLRGNSAVLLLPDEVCHYSPIPDPIARFRGMSWLTPVLRDIESDKAATKHKSRFFANAATPNIAVSLAKEITPENFHKFVDIMDARHSGVDNAYKTLYTAGGADVTVIGADMKQLDFRATQGFGETRVAAAARVHPVIVGLSEGLAGSSLNAGNYAAARRGFADGTMRPLWRMAAASLQTLVTPPTAKSSLWYDDRDVAFLREDAKDLAEIQNAQATALASLVMNGWDGDAAVEFLRSDDLTQLLGKHDGLTSVQRQPDNAAKVPPPVPASEGNPNAA